MMPKQLDADIEATLSDVFPDTAGGKMLRCKVVALIERSYSTGETDGAPKG
jgi:hypothetical protein